jgi:glycosyltransferase involved in cell wall biosynthesis
MRRTYALLVPCYNAENYIDKFLNNISNLHRPFDEIIFYDDGSLDSTYKVLISNGLRVIKGGINRGPGFARNRLAEAANSSHIHFHDVDDEFNSAFLELVDGVFEQYEVDVVLGNADWIDAESRTPIIRWRYDAGEIRQNPLMYFISHPLGIINTVYKKEAFLKVNGFNESIKCWEDADLHVRLAACGTSFGVVDNVLAYSLRHNHGISTDQLWCWDCRLKFIKNYLNNFRDIIPDQIFRTELKRVQTMYIVSREYKKLADILSLNISYKLHMKTTKIFLLFYASKLLPEVIISWALQYIRMLSSSGSDK